MDFKANDNIISTEHPIDKTLLHAIEYVELRNEYAKSKKRLALFDAIDSATTSMIRSFDATGRSEYVNAAWISYTRLTLKQIQDMQAEQIIHPDDLPQVMQMWEIARERGEAYEVDYRYRRYDGEYRWFLSSIVPIRDAVNGPVIRWVNTLTDIHDRKEMEQTIQGLSHDLKQRTEELHSALEMVPVGIAIAHDVECKTMTGNPEFTRMLRLPSNANVSKSAVLEERPNNFTIWRNGNPLAPEDLPMQLAASSGQRVTGEDFDLLFDDCILSMFGYAVPLFDADGQLRGSIGAFIDVTERRKMEEALRDSLDRIQFVNAAFGIGTWDWNIKTDVITWAPEIYDLFGIHSDIKPSYKGWLNAIHPDDRSMADEATQVLFKNASELHSEFRVTHPIKGVRWLLSVAKCVQNDSQKAVGVIGFVLDITEQKQAQEELKANLERLRFINSEFGIGTWELNLNTKVMNWSPELYDLLGLDSSKKWSYDEWLNTVHPDDRALADEGARNMFWGNPVLRCEYRAIHPIKGIRWLVRLSKVIQNGTNEPVQVIGIVMDITEQKQAQEQVRLSEQRYQYLVSTTMSTVWTANADGEFVQHQPSWENYTGQPWEEYQKTGRVKMVHPDDRAGLLEAWNRAKETKSAFEAEGRIWHAASGEYHYNSLHAVPIFNTDGSMLEWVGCEIDVDESKRLEREREEALSLLNTILNGIPIGFAFLDNDLRYRRVNDAFTKINGISAIDHIGRTVIEVAPNNPEQWVSLLSMVKETGEAVINKEFEGESASDPGIMHHWLKSAYPVLSNNGENLGIGKIVVDVTEIRRAQKEIVSLNERLHRAVVEGWHRQKNQMQQLTGMLELILMDNSDTVPVEEVKRIGNQMRAIATIHDLMTIGTKQQSTTGTLSAKTLLERVVPLLQKAMGNPNLTLWTEDANISVKVATALSLILHELITNAVKHGGGGAKIHFYSEDNLCRLVVEDSGEGFPDGFNPHTDANTGLELVENLTGIDLLGKSSYENAVTGGGRVVISFPTASMSKG